MARTKPVLKLGQRQHLVAKVDRELDAYLRSDRSQPRHRDSADALDHQASALAAARAELEKLTRDLAIRMLACKEG